MRRSPEEIVRPLPTFCLSSGNASRLVCLMTDMPLVALRACRSYSDDLAGSVTALLGPLGGLSAHVTSGQTVLVKPNLLTDRHPDKAVTTHPELVRCLVRCIRGCGATPVVADSPAASSKLQRVWAETGYEALCREEGIDLIGLEQEASVRCERDGFVFHIARAVMDADIVINVPKVKTHVLTTLTAAVKNLFGTLPGYQKAHLHRDHATVRDFARLLRAIHDSLPPALSVADGVLGMEGEGPSGGTPRALGFLAASSNAYALDQVICSLLDIPVKSVPYLPPQQPVRVVGDSLPALQVTGFKRPSTLAARLVPKWLAKLLAPLVWIRPAIDEACVFCGQCVKACPVQALEMEPRHRPHLRPERCIGCCCCHEVCPENAVTMRQSPFLSAVRRGKQP